MITAIPEPGSSEATLVEPLRTTQSLKHHGLSEGEINRAKAVLLRELKKAAAEKGRHDSSALLNAPTAHFLKGSPVLDPSWELHAAEQLLPLMGKEELTSQVASLFIHEDLSIVLYGPSAEIANYPNEERIGELVSIIQEEEPEALPADEENTGLLSVLPKPGIRMMR